MNDPFETKGKGYDRRLQVTVKEELSEADIERVRLLILEYLV